MPKKKKQAKQKTTGNSYTVEVVVISLFVVSFLLVIGMYFNKGGILGSAITDMLCGLFGASAYILPIIIIATIIYALKNRKKDVKRSKYVLVVSEFLVVSAMVHIAVSQYEVSPFDISGNYIDGCNWDGGGVFGALIAESLRTVLGMGANVILIALLIIFAMYIFNFSIFKLIGYVVKSTKSLSNSVKADFEKMNSDKGKKTDDGEKKRMPIINIFDEDEDRPSNTGTVVEPKIEDYIVEEHIEPEIKVYDDGQVGLAEVMGEEGEKVDEKKDEPRSDAEIVSELSNAAQNNVIEYEFPSIELLEKPKVSKDSANTQKQLRENGDKLIETLKSFGVDARVLEISKGPTVTRYEIAPSAGVKVSKITNLADDIALNLAATGVRIEAPIPGKAAVGIEIANKDVNTVTLREVIDTREFKNFGSKLAVALGKDISGKPIIIDIAKMPHLLIAGATGAGKSVCINTLITSILYKANPNEVKLVMIDPKVVELGVYNGTPHLLIPVVTDPKKAAGALNWAVTEMTERYKLFADNDVRNIKGYNELMEMNGTPENKMPQIVIIIDELADLMMVAPSDVENYICRLAQMARAAGMHLVIATQRPSVNIITGTIKANIPSRISFMVSSQIDSRTILDMGGAEKLIGRGDMLYMPVGASKPTRLQCSFVSDKEVENIVAAVSKDFTPQYKEDIIEQIEKEEEYNPDGDDAGDADELLASAIEMVIDAGQISTSLLQRRFSIGYNRAGRIIDQMEARGIISGLDGNKPRKALITRAEYNEMLMNS